MNNRGAVVERSCVRRKDLCARSEIVVYSAVTLTAVCVLVFALALDTQFVISRGANLIRSCGLRVTTPCFLPVPPKFRKSVKKSYFPLC